MTMDVGPFLETVAPLSILVAAAFGIGRVLYKLDEHGKRFQEYRKETGDRFAELNTKFDDLADKHRGLETRVLEEEMYQRGLADAAARRRVMGQPSKKGRARK